MNKKIFIISTMFLLVLPFCYGYGDILGNVSNFTTDDLTAMQGIAYDHSNNTLWLLDINDNTIHSYLPNGSKMSGVITPTYTVVTGTFAANKTHLFVCDNSPSGISVINKQTQTTDFECVKPTNNTCRSLFFSNNGSDQQIWIIIDDTIDKVFRGDKLKDGLCYNWSFNFSTYPPVSSSQYGGGVWTQKGFYYYLGFNNFSQYNQTGNFTNNTYDFGDLRGLTFNITNNNSIQAFVARDTNYIEMRGVNTTTYSLDITFYDEITETILDNSTIDLDVTIEGILAQNHNTTNGVISVGDLIPGQEYRLVFSTDEYEQRHYYISIPEQNNTENIRLNLYLLSSGNATNVNLYLTDLYDNELVGYYVHLLRYYVSSNTYKTMEILKTDENGMVKHEVVLNDVFYKWIFKKPDGTVVKITEGQPIYLTTLNYKLSIEDVYLSQYTTINEITTNFQFNNVTNEVTMTYTAPTITGASYCLRLERVSAFSFGIVNDTCLTSQSGSISYTITDLTANYIATAYVITPGSPLYKTALGIKDIIYKNEWKSKFSSTGLFIDGLFVMSMSIIGFGVGGMVGSIIMAIVGIGVYGLIGITILRIGTYIGIIVFALVLIYKIRR